MARLYAPYWEKLKAEKELIVTCFTTSVTSLKRMIMKEKDEDVVFKLENNEAGMAWAITTTVEQLDPTVSKVTFKLRLKSMSI